MKPAIRMHVLHKNVEILRAYVRHFAGRGVVDRMRIPHELTVKNGGTVVPGSEFASLEHDPVERRGLIS